MRYYELNENLEQLKNDADDLKEKISVDCSEYLSIKSIQNLYRGSKRTAYWYESESREFRKPIDMGFEFQQKFDSIMKNKGMTALRSSSVFATSCKETASRFGNIYILYPKNDFDFSWLEYVSNISGISQPVRDLSSVVYVNHEGDISMFSNSKLRFHKTDLVDAMEKHAEILIKGSYYAISEVMHNLFFKNF